MRQRDRDDDNVCSIVRRCKVQRCWRHISSCNISCTWDLTIKKKRGKNSQSKSRSILRCPNFEERMSNLLSMIMKITFLNCQKKKNFLKTNHRILRKEKICYLIIFSYNTTQKLWLKKFITAAVTWFCNSLNCPLIK